MRSMTGAERIARFSDLRVPVVTRREASALAAARSALAAIDARATRAAWNRPAGEGRSLGRLAGTAAAAADVLFDVLNVASSYCDSEQARKQLHS